MDKLGLAKGHKTLFLCSRCVKNLGYELVIFFYEEFRVESLFTAVT